MRGCRGLGLSKGMADSDSMGSPELQQLYYLKSLSVKFLSVQGSIKAFVARLKSLSHGKHPGQVPYVDSYFGL